MHALPLTRLSRTFKNLETIFLFNMCSVLHGDQVLLWIVNDTVRVCLKIVLLKKFIILWLAAQEW